MNALRTPPSTTVGAAVEGIQHFYEAPAENRLAVAIEAGKEIPYERQDQQ